MTNKKEKVGNAFCHIYLIVLSLIAVFPLVWVLLCSVKSSGELTSNPTRFFPKHFTLENFTHVIQDLGFAKNIGNSLIIAIITTGIAIVISSMAAYGIVRFFPKLGSIMSKVLVATYMFPPILLAIPYSMVMAKLGLVNTRIGLIIVYLSFSVPYAVWMLVGFFKTVPLGIEEAAKVDGANKFQTFIQISDNMQNSIERWKRAYGQVTEKEIKKLEMEKALKKLLEDFFYVWNFRVLDTAFVREFLKHKNDDRYKRAMIVLIELMDKETKYFPELTKREANIWLIREIRDADEMIEINAYLGMLRNHLRRKEILGF